MEAKCPKCDNDEFDVYDMDFSLLDEYVHCFCVCDGCGKEFTIRADIVITEIK